MRHPQGPAEDENCKSDFSTIDTCNNTFKTINITSYSEYVGGEVWNDYTQCRSKTGIASCTAFVAKTPSAFDEVHFLIKSVKTFTD